VAISVRTPRSSFRCGSNGGQSGGRSERPAQPSILGQRGSMRFASPVLKSQPDAGAVRSAAGVKGAHLLHQHFTLHRARGGHPGHRERLPHRGGLAGIRHPLVLRVRQLPRGAARPAAKSDLQQQAPPVVETNFPKLNRLNRNATRRAWGRQPTEGLPQCIAGSLGPVRRLGEELDIGAMPLGSIMTRRVICATEARAHPASILDMALQSEQHAVGAVLCPMSRLHLRRNSADRVDAANR